MFQDQAAAYSTLYNQPLHWSRRVNDALGAETLQPERETMTIPWDEIIDKLFDMLDRCFPSPEQPSSALDGIEGYASACEGVCKDRCDYVRENVDTRRFRASVRRAVRSAGTPFRLRSEAVEQTIDDVKAMSVQELAAVCMP